MPTPRPFPTAESAWFWTSAALLARRDPSGPRPPPGPCRPEDVVKCLDALYRRRRIELLHAHILRIWGQRGVAPNPARPRERCDWRLWREALDRLDWPLRQCGIVAYARVEPDGIRVTNSTEMAESASIAQ